MTRINKEVLYSTSAKHYREEAIEENGFGADHVVIE